MLNLYLNPSVNYFMIHIFMWIFVGLCQIRYKPAILIEMYDGDFKDYYCS